MKKNKYIEKTQKAMNKVVFEIRRYSPEIMVAAGVVGVVVSGVMACKATTKISKVAESTKDQVDAVHNALEAVNSGEEIDYSEDDSKRDLAIIYTQAAVKYVRLYAPSVILASLSIGSILASNRVMRKRNTALAAAYVAVDQGFKDYRKRVRDRFGDDVDQELRHGIKCMKVTEKCVDENGNETGETKEVDAKVVDSCSFSQYARFFDESSDYWHKSAVYNKLFVQSQERYANDLLRTKGYLFLNEVYKMLGMKETVAGQSVGWVYEPDNANYDNCVDFGLTMVDRPSVQDFLNGYENVVLLDFNVDGPILERAKLEAI